MGFSPDLATVAALKAQMEACEKARKLLIFLGIDIVGGTHVHIMELYDHLTDEKKFKTLVSKLNNKTFW